MCTVTYLPSADGGYILTSNRDESALRARADPPRKFKISNQFVFFPKDQHAGGTWIATSVSGFTLCLLNGAFERHIRNKNYRLSRGLVLLDFFKFNDPEKYAGDYNFDGVEPFTLVIAESVKNRKLWEMLWDGNKPFLRTIRAEEPHVWSSVTLYEKPVIKERERWFEEWKKNHPDPDVESVMKFHQFGGTGDMKNDLVMNRDNRLFTVSITSIHKSERSMVMKYIDLPEDKKYDIRVI
jgi:hypothetical protein